MKKHVVWAVLAAGYLATSGYSAVSAAPQSPLRAVSFSPKPANLAVTSQVAKRFVPDADDDGSSHRYIIQLQEPALASHLGGAKQASSQKVAQDSFTFAQTRPRVGLDLTSADSRNYRAQLQANQQRFQQRAAQRLGSPMRVLATTQLALNGLIVEATQDQMIALAREGQVKRIEKDKRRQLLTDRGPGWIGAEPVWQGSGTDAGYQGEGVTVGILDSGVDVTNPAFAAESGDGYVHTNPYGSGVYKGDCIDAPELCNDKLVGVYSWDTITDLYNGQVPADGRDYNGHGSHTASTTAGNVLLDVPVYNADGEPSGFSFERISGVAPRANIISYQTCLPGDAGDPLAGCFTSLAILAVEAAIQDGVKVLNYSVGGGSSDPWNDGESVAFLNARAAGIHVVTSAGNSGPTPGTVGSPGDNPWLTSVAAMTHDRSFDDKLLTLSGGDSSAPSGITGKSITGALAATPMLYAGDIPNPNDPNGDPAQCLQPYPSGTFSGQVVVCDRGSIARVAKGQNVAAGGAGGLVLVNLPGGADNVVADAHVIPALHIDATFGQTLKSWLATGSGHTAAMPNTTVSTDASQGDIVAGFSSRGPNISVPSTLSPHLGAPGVDIYAAYASETPFKSLPDGSPFAFLSGTSMASPHVAGSLALIAGLRPAWTPAQAQSALMLTASANNLKEDGVSNALPFDVGAGRVQVDRAVNSPLLMDISFEEYVDANPSEGGDPANLNMAALADSECVGSCSWTRRFTATTAGSFTAEGVAITEGVSITIEPSSFSISPDDPEPVTLTITADVLNAPRETWVNGYVALSGNGDELRMPLVAFSSIGNLPEQVNIQAYRDADSIVLADLTAIAITDFSVDSFGLVPALQEQGSLMEDSNNSDPFDDLEDGVVTYLYAVPEGSKRFVTEIIRSEAPDIDLFVGIDANDDGQAQAEELVMLAATGSALERIEIPEPAAGNYWVLVQNWLSSADGAEDEFTLSTGVVSGDPSTNLSVEAPSDIGDTETFDLRILWDTEMDQGERFYGALELATDPASPGNLGLMRIDLTRGEDDVQLTTVLPESQVLDPGQSFEYELNLRANQSSEPIDYDVSVTLPAPVTVDPATLPEGASVSGQTISFAPITLMGLAGEPVYRYQMTSNADDPSCTLPDLGQGEGYIDLLTVANLRTDPNLSGDTVSWAWDRSHTFLGEQYQTLYFNDDGFIGFSDDFSGVPWVNQKLPDTTAPNQLLAFLWRDGLIEYDLDSNSGVTLAVADDLSLIEYDNLVTFFANTDAQAADMADVEILLRSVGDGPEIMVAFDNVVHDFGSILGATIGYEDALGQFGDNFLFHAFDNPIGAIGELETQIQSGTILCFDQVTNPNAQEPIRFSATLANDVADGVYFATLSSDSSAPGTRLESNERAAPISVGAVPMVTIDQGSQLTVMEQGSLTLTGQAEDRSGQPLSYRWRQLTGPLVSIANEDQPETQVQLPIVEQDATVTLQLEVSNGAASGFANIDLLVQNNQAPRIELSNATVEASQSVTLVATVTDPEQDPMSFSWLQQGGPSAAVQADGASLTVTAPDDSQGQTLGFLLTVSDGFNEVSQSVEVTVADSNSPSPSSGGDDTPTADSGGDSGGGSLSWWLLALLAILTGRRRL
ncbi:S8 family serine peptidase [Ferrimonas marina]|uniref:GlyGly-CTERM domain-containing protein n=1 Tax=Ferrimonas marina TaxID=299255 RepID=A0A1M5ZGF2_9GAMM|nr:S8 family serine peptidase [Ferrimonas marina]SHI22983.1 GlyGly-CTERM domain-containing protein [Ferrimonas marina]